METPSRVLPEPRSFAGTAITVAAIAALPFALLSSILFAAAEQLSFGAVLPIGLGAGVAFGVLYGVAVAFLFKGQTATIDVADRKDFVARLDVATSQLGYRPATHTEDFLTYRPSLRAGLASGRISVQMRDETALIVGPKVLVKKLLRRLETPAAQP